MNTQLLSTRWWRAAGVSAWACASSLWVVGCGETVYEPEPVSARQPAVGAEVQPPPSLNQPMVVGPVSAPGNAAVAPELPPNAAASEPVPSPTDGTRKPAQVSDAKPMPGQNNDHSAPLASPR